MNVICQHCKKNLPVKSQGVQLVACECGAVYRVNPDNMYMRAEPRPAGSPPIAGAKHDTGKPPITLLDRDFLEGTAQVMRFGAVKYAEFNWCGGIKHRRLADAAMRHIIAWAAGEDLDPESGLPHIDHAAASLNMLRGMQRLHPELDDRYRREAKHD